MIDPSMITPETVSTLMGYMGLAWCAGNLGWGLLRNQARLTMIYGVGCFAAFVVWLNVGGVVNATTWGAFGTAVFGLRMLFSLLVRRSARGTALFGFMFGTSALSLLGVL